MVVNDALVLIDFINKRRRSGVPMAEAIREAGKVRFRPIVLTSLTTFLGVLPLILEKSLQAQFLIPMAVSLGFGILFATFILAEERRRSPPPTAPPQRAGFGRG